MTQRIAEKTPPDDYLVQQYCAGEVDAFEVLYVRYAPRVLGFLRNLGGGQIDAAVADDLAQQTWFRVVDRIESYQPQNQFRSWLFQIAHRAWIDSFRRSQARPSVMLEEAYFIPATDQGPVEYQINKETKDQINDAIEALPESMRETLLLRVDGELTCREIAETLDCPLGTVLWRLREARQRLAKIFDGWQNHE